MVVWGVLIVLIATAVIVLREVRRALVWAFYALCMLAFFMAWELMIYAFTAVPRFVYGACPDPDCAGHLGPAERTGVTADAIQTLRRCTSCGTPEESEVTFAEIEQAGRMMTPFS